MNTPVTELHTSMSAVESVVSAGSLFVVGGGRGSQPFIALSAPDADGYLRFAPVIIGDTNHRGFGLALEASDFSVGGMLAWIRLDRLGWQYVEGAEVIGALKA